MHITFLALGSRGDVVPFMTLAKALLQAGHQIRFITFENFEPLIVESGLEFHPVRGDMRHLMGGAGGQALAASGQNPLKMAWSILRMFGVMADGFAQDLSDPKLGETDLLINQLPGGLFGNEFVEKYGLRQVLVAVIPMTPTRYEPMLAFPTALARVPGYNALTHRIAYQLVWQIYRPAVSRWRKRTLGLSAAPILGYGRTLESAQVPVLNGFSRHVVPRPADWGAHVHLTGYWFPEQKAWQPPPQLEAFIEEGTRPVFIGFGSMPVPDPKATTETVLDALEMSGQRAILHMGWAGLGNTDLPETVMPVDYVPYDWLFPRMAAVVHHGGSGTTGFGLRAGVPTIIAPFVFDQFYWGRRVHDLGVGPAPIPQKKLTAAKLAKAIEGAVSDGSMRRRAAELGEKVRAEDGLAEGVRLIEQLTS